MAEPAKKQLHPSVLWAQTSQALLITIDVQVCSGQPRPMRAGLGLDWLPLPARPRSCRTAATPRST